jgi:AsmA protein
MKLAVRIIAALVALVVLVFALLAAYLGLIFDPNDYRERLAEQVKAHTGRELVIAGDIGLSLFPWLGIELAQVSLGNAPGFGEQPFARVAAVDARVRLIPLVQRRIEIDRVRLDGLELNLARDAAGRSNWEDLRRPAQPGAPDAGEQEAQDAQDAAAGVAALAVAGIEIASARVEFDDRQNGVRHTVHDLSLTTGAVRPGESFPLSLAMNIASTEPALEGRLELDGEVLLQPDREQYAVDGLTLHLDARGAGLPGGAVDLRGKGKLAVDLAQQTLALDGLQLSAYALTATGTIRGTEIGSAGKFSGPLQVAEFNPRELLQALGKPAPASADAGVLKRASLQARLEAGGGRVMLDALELRLDDSTLRGSLGLADTARRALRFDLALDAIDVDRYLPPRQPDAPAAVATPGAAAAAAEPDALRTLDLQGRLRVGKLKASGLQLADIDLNARAGGGVLRLQPLGAALYGGRYAGNVTLDARGRALRLNLDETLNGVQVGPLLRDLTGKPERLTGQAQLRARLQGTGNDADALKRSLAGNVEFRFADGAVKGFNVARFLREAEARLKGAPVPPAEAGTEQTDFSELSGTVQFADGVGRNSDLAAKSPLLRVKGSGSFDLGREQIDYLALASVVGTLTGQGGKELERLRGVTVPIRIRGSFAQPAYALDVERLLADNVKGQVREQLEQKLEKELDPRLREGLKGLFR